MGNDPLTDKEKKAAYFKKYYAENKEKIAAKKRERSEAKSEELKLQTKAWHKTNPDKSLWLAAKSRAKRQGVPFDLSLEDIVFPEVCPVFGIPLFFSETGRTDNTPSIDKRKKELGYTKDNIRIISWRANRLKSDATAEELAALAEYARG